MERENGRDIGERETEIQSGDKKDVREIERQLKTPSKEKSASKREREGVKVPEREKMKN